MTAPKVFISYSHDSETHKARVVELSKRLREDGIDCMIDQYVAAPPEGWTLWMQRQLEDSRFVLIVCTEIYADRVARRVSTGNGVKYEGALIIRELYEAGMNNERFVPVLLDGADSDHIPKPLRDYTHYRLNDAYEDLVKFLRGQLPEIPALGGTAERPTPKYSNDDISRIGEELKAARNERKALKKRGEESAALNKRIIELERVFRAGVQLEPGDTLSDDRYELIERIGHGGFADVWLAWDEERDHRVAIKILHNQYARDATRLKRFKSGARQMGKLDHPNIVRVLDSMRESRGYHFFVMEYVERGDFQKAVRDGRLSLEDRWRIIQQVGDALQYAHERGVIHRDVKPANILIDADLNAKLTDFDLVRAAETTGGTRTGAMGTFVYAAPEMLQRPQDAEPTVDVYGLGMTAIFALYGRDLPPHVFRDAGLFLVGVDCSDSMTEVLTKAVDWDVKKRWPTVAAFCGALERARNSARESPSPEQATTEVVDSAPAIRLHSKLEDLFQWIETKDGRVKLWRTIPAGSFLMGSPRNEEGRDDDEGPQHRVEILQPFQMACVPVTQEQFRAFDPNHRSHHDGDRNPVERVTWYRAVEFCEWLSKTLAWAKGARLPTEEEWEYACRAGTTTRFWSGDGEKDLDRVGWYGEGSEGNTYPVGQKDANSWGLYDVHGNVWEWTCSERGSYEAADISVDPRSDPAALSPSAPRVVRGGSFRFKAWVARSAYRYWDEPGVKDLDQG